MRVIFRQPVVLQNPAVCSQILHRSVQQTPLRTPTDMPRSELLAAKTFLAPYGGKAWAGKIELIAEDVGASDPAVSECTMA